MVTCKLCRTKNNFAKSHIIPKSLYGSTLGCASGPTKIIASDPESWPKRSPVGEYDDRLLCVGCEGRLSPYDGYACELFKRMTPSAEIKHNGELLAYRYDEVDLSRLWLFFISLLWRMHATQRPMFGAVNLGQYAEAFRQAILTENYSAVPELDVVITKYEQTDMGLLGPTRLRIDGVNGHRITFQGYSVWAKIDRRQVPAPFEEVALTSAAPLHMLAMDFRDSAEFRAMLKLVKLH